MTQRAKRPEQVNGVQVRMPEDYDFSTFGTSSLTQERTGVSMIRTTSSEPTQSGKKTNSRTGSDLLTEYFKHYADFLLQYFELEVSVHRARRYLSVDL